MNFVYCIFVTQN